MELTKLSNEDIKAFDLSRLSEVENDIRRHLAMDRMNIYADKKQAGSVREMKRNLARVLTYRNELLRSKSK